MPQGHSGVRVMSAAAESCTAKSAYIATSRPRRTSGSTTCVPDTARVFHGRSTLGPTRASRACRGQYLLFQRLIRPGLYAVDTEKVMLFDRRRQVMKTLAVARRPPRDDFAPSVATGQLNGRYASWLRVVWTEKSLGGGSYYDAPHSLVGLYDVETGNLVTHRLPPSSFVSTSAVSSNGSLYYVQYAVTASADESVTPGCLMKQALGGAPELIAKMPSRHLVSDLYVDDRSDGSHLVYFTVADSEGTAGGNQIFSITDLSPPSSRD
jgi:hypothetical protein